MRIGLGLGLTRPRGSAAVIWSPGDSTPLEWLDVGAPGATWTTIGKTVAATSPGDPVGALVPQGGPAGDWRQSFAGRRMLLGTIGSQVAMVSDHNDDAIERISGFVSAGAKTLGIRAQYNSAIATGDLDVLVVVGGTTRGFQVRIGGPTSSSPGLSFAADITGPTVSRRVSTWQPGTDPLSIVIVYRGGGNTTTANYSVWVNGVALTIDTTGASFDVSTTSYVLNAGPVTNPVNGKFAKMCVVAEDMSANPGHVTGWLERLPTP